MRDFLITAPGQYRTLDAYYVDPINKYIRSIYQRLAPTHRAVVMQTDATACGSACRAAFVNAYENPANYRPQDGIHWALAGHEAWAQQLVPLLAPLVGGARSRSIPGAPCAGDGHGASPAAAPRYVVGMSAGLTA